MPGWNFAVLVDAIAREAPDLDAVVHGGRRATWLQFASRARSLAWYLHGDGRLAPGDKVAIVLPNCPEYLETFVAARKLQCIPLNVGTGYSLDALRRIVDVSDAKAVVHSPALAERVHDAIRRIPKRWRPIAVETGAQYDREIAAAAPPSEWAIETPSADDLIFLATRDQAGSADESGVKMLALAPFAPGNGLVAVLEALGASGTVIFPDARGFDPRQVWATVEKERVTMLTIDGDALARPLLAALTATEARYSLGSLRIVSSSGTQLSPDVAGAFVDALPGVRILDTGTEHPESASGSTHMIRPSDVEARLRKHASVAECVVVGISDPRIGKKVVALVQVTENHYLDEPELAAWCQAHLPGTMTPARFVFIDEINHSCSGETDYPALRSIAIDRLAAEP